MKGLLLVVLVACGQALACESVSLHINGISHHTGPGKFNEFNPGLGASCEYKTGRSFGGDVYRDSNEDLSGYLAHEWRLVTAGPVSGGVMAGVMYRRTAADDGWPVFPFAVPYLSLSAGRFSVSGYAAPPLWSEAGFVFGAQLRIRI